MRGLMVKDLRLMLQKKSTLAVLLIITLFLMVQQGGMFAVMYLTMLAVVFAISTVSYDEYDNGYLFLMTLPVDRKTYVREKYLLIVFVEIVGCLAGSAMFVVYLATQGGEMNLVERIAEAVVYLLAALLVADVMLPLQMKFGAEQGRMVLVLAIGALGAVGAICVKLLQRNGSLKGVVGAVSGMGMWGVVGCLTVLSLLLTLLSYCVSVHVMEKKEF